MREVFQGDRASSPVSHTALVHTLVLGVLTTLITVPLGVAFALGVDRWHGRLPEGATVAFERTQVATLLERARAQLSELDAAQERLRTGRYGVCERCGREIPADRLEAQPAARLCVACAAP